MWVTHAANFWFKETASFLKLCHIFIQEGQQSCGLASLLLFLLGGTDFGGMMCKTKSNWIEWRTVKIKTICIEKSTMRRDNNGNGMTCWPHTKGSPMLNWSKELTENTSLLLMRTLVAQTSWTISMPIQEQQKQCHLRQHEKNWRVLPAWALPMSTTEKIAMLLPKQKDSFSTISL